MNRPKEHYEMLEEKYQEFKKMKMAGAKSDMNEYEFKIRHYRIPTSRIDLYGETREAMIYLERYYRGKGFHMLGDVEPYPKGGLTICKVYNGRGEEILEARARCSIKDNFCYSLGRKIAKGRALKALT